MIDHAEAGASSAHILAAAASFDLEHQSYESRFDAPVRINSPRWMGRRDRHLATLSAIETKTPKFNSGKTNFDL